MENKGNLSALIEEWAKNTVQAYHKLAMREDMAYYTQSDLSKIEEQPDLMIIGINPNSTSTYQDQRKNENWSYLYQDPLDKNHLLKGNYCREKGQPSSENRRKWKYWAGLKDCLSKTCLSEVMEDERKIILTNASLFNTKKANGISEKLLMETIPMSLQLINITDPKHIVFLSGKHCFNRLKRLSVSSGIFEFQYKPVCGNIFVGALNDKLCIGIPHPTYKSREELNLIAAVMPFLLSLSHYYDLDLELINKDCSLQIDEYNRRILRR